MPVSHPIPVPDADAFIVDTHGFGLDQYCGVFVLPHAEGTALIETGPSTTVERVREAMRVLKVRPDEVTHILPTHIHLDHCGALWQLLDECPNARAVVHANGSPFLTDREKVGKLLVSVERAVGTSRFPLYGTFEAIDPARVLAVKGGERIEAAGRTLAIVDAPGHAPHQFVVHDVEHGILYAADSAGIRTPSGPVLLTTPPPRFDLDAWEGTLDRMEALDARWLALTHYGWAQAKTHLPVYRDTLEAWVDHVTRHRDEGRTLDETIHEMAKTYEAARAVYDEATFEEEVTMNVTGVWLWLERGA